MYEILGNDRRVFRSTSEKRNKNGKVRVKGVQ